MVDELADGADVLFDRVAVVLRTIGKAEAEVVDRDAAEAIAQTPNDAAVEEAPGGIAVAEEYRPAGAFVDVVHAAG